MDRPSSLPGPLLCPVTKQGVSPAGRDMSRTERLIILALLAAALTLRVLYAFHYRPDTDEPQHLHVAWGWATGLLQYRDLFDNHMPLFHILMAPLVWLLGERADLLVLMRLAMLPLYAVSLACVYWIARSLWNRRVGLWSAAWAGLLRPLFLDSAEFRADDLWMACWLAAVALLVRLDLGAWRGLLAGLVLGVTIGVSIKTSFLIAGLLLAFVGTVVLARWYCPGHCRLVRMVPAGLAIVSGMLVVPLGIGLYFHLCGAFGPFWYGAIEHNLRLPMDRAWGHWPLSLAGLALMVMATWLVVRSGGGPAVLLRRLFLTLLCGAMLMMLDCSPIVSRQSYLVIYPLLAILAVAMADQCLAWAARPGRGGPRLTLPVLATVVAIVELGILVAKIPQGNEMARAIGMWRDVLRLTDPGQVVMDLKGEFIFRPRAYFYVLETVTSRLLETGRLPEDIAECLVARRVCVASPGRLRLPLRAREFIRDNYIPVGRLLVAGKRLDAVPGPDGAVAFDVRIPARYAIFSDGARVYGVLDGRPYEGPRQLEAGRHTYRPASGQRGLTLVWAQALERGFQPASRRPIHVNP